MCNRVFFRKCATPSLLTCSIQNIFVSFFLDFILITLVMFRKMTFLFPFIQLLERCAQEFQCASTVCTQMTNKNRESFKKKIISASVCLRSESLFFSLGSFEIIYLMPLRHNPRSPSCRSTKHIYGSGPFIAGRSEGAIQNRLFRGNEASATH